MPYKKTVFLRIDWAFFIGKKSSKKPNKSAILVTKAAVSEIGVIGSFLRKNHRLLRVSSLTLLSTLVKNGLKQCDEVLVELPLLINDQDMHIAQLG